MQYSPFLPAQQVKDFFKLSEHLQAWLHCVSYGIEIILIYFILIVLPAFLYQLLQGSEFTNVNIFFFYQLNFQQFQVILGSEK